MNSLSIFGTSSDAGKSTLAFAITYLLHKNGINVAPFKAQNVSNNSQVTDKGGEIAIPQHFAASAIGLSTSPLFNPILLKSGGGGKSHIIINGKSVQNIDVWNYYRNIKELQPIVKKAFQTLQQEYECIVAEGAGSPVELNLMQKDLSNIFIAKKFNTKIILVADIQRGGVFASIYGVYNLLPKKLQRNVIGVIVNKFQGDMRLFDDGVKIIEDRFGLKVLGVVPFKPFNLGFEDSASLMGYTQNKTNPLLRVGVIKLPHISNFTDFEPLVVDEEIELSFITSTSEAKNCDVIVFPGSKLVIKDLAWLKERGFELFLQETKNMIVAICGGYEMMFEKIIDEKNIESSQKLTYGFAKFSGYVTFEKEKIVRKSCYNIFNIMVDGYEIHNGITKKLSKKKKNIYGTFVHGIFDNDELRLKLFSKVNKNYKGYNFKEYKQKAIAEFAQHIDEHIDLKYIKKKLI